MKRTAILVAGLGAFVGTPLVLVAIAGQPTELVTKLIVQWPLASASTRLLGSSVLLLWLLWLWVVLSAAIDVIRLRRGAVDLDRLTTRFMMVFLAAVSSVGIPRLMVTPTSLSTSEVDANSTEKAQRALLQPLGLMASLFAVSHVLMLLHDRRQKTVRAMRAGDRLAAVRGSDAMFWRALLLAATQSSNDEHCERGVKIPVGQRGDAVLTVPVRGGESIGVESSDPVGARAVVRHLQWMVESVSRNGHGPPVSVCLGLRDGQEIQIAQDELGWKLVSSGERFDVFGVSDDENAMVTRLLDRASTTESRPRVHSSGSWRVLVRLMGPITIESHAGRKCIFEKARSVELLSWLVTHRERPLRSAARTAMWETNVQNATFNNVVSYLRTALQEYLEDSGIVALDKTFDEHLILHPSVVSDVELLEAALQSYTDEPSDQTRDVLRLMLGLVRDMPFLGADYLWPDPEGITSNIVHLIVSASQMLAEGDLERGNTKDVFVTTGQGLKVLRGHEGLIGLRMRAYAIEGNASGVRQEWERYEGTIRDQYGEQDWARLKLRRLRDELLGVVAVD